MSNLVFNPILFAATYLMLLGIKGGYYQDMGIRKTTAFHQVAYFASSLPWGAGRLDSGKRILLLARREDRLDVSDERLERTRNMFKISPEDGMRANILRGNRLPCLYRYISLSALHWKPQSSILWYKSGKTLFIYAYIYSCDLCFTPNFAVYHLSGGYQGPAHVTQGWERLSTRSADVKGGLDQKYPTLKHEYMLSDSLSQIIKIR